LKPLIRSLQIHERACCSAFVAKIPQKVVQEKGNDRFSVELVFQSAPPALVEQLGKWDRRISIGALKRLIHHVCRFEVGILYIREMSFGE